MLFFKELPVFLTNLIDEIRGGGGFDSCGLAKTEHRFSKSATDASFKNCT